MRRVVDASLGILVKASNESRQPAKYVFDTGFVDDIAVTSSVLANL
jgi:hypothetical protein